jgi:glycosyltransferase involved in cell wall biosynthesis
MQNILVLSIYPAQGTLYDKTVGGAAHYIKRVIQQVKGTNFIVLAEKRGPNYKNEAYFDDPNIAVHRNWNVGSWFFWVPLTKSILAEKSHAVILNFEFNIFGGKNKLPLLLIPLLVARLSGKKLYIIQHQMVEHIRDLSKHLNLPEEGFYINMLNFLIKTYTSLLFLLANKVVVFDEVLKQRAQHLLTDFRRKVTVIPHPVYGTGEVKRARKALKNEFNVLYFGFVTWYKGADWLVQQTFLDSWPENTNVIIAGGLSVTTPDKSFYERFTDFVLRSRFISHTGYVSEEEIGKYFKKSDLVVLPYRVLMSSSGPLATALGYKKPFLISEALLPYTRTEDFAKVLTELELSRSDVSFTLEDDQLAEKVKELQRNPEYYKKLCLLSERLAELRSIEKIGAKHAEFLN